MGEGGEELLFVLVREWEVVELLLEVVDVFSCLFVLLLCDLLGREEL